MSDNKTYKIHYVGTLANGETFDSSRERNEPLEFQAGQGHLLEAFEAAAIALAEGETTTVTLSPEQAYGERIEDAVQVIDRDKLPEDFGFTTGDRVETRDDQGNPLRAVITEDNDDSVTFDFNHPLAGQSLTFDIELLDVSTS